MSELIRVSLEWHHSLIRAQLGSTRLGSARLSLKQIDHRQSFRVGSFVAGWTESGRQAVARLASCFGCPKFSLSTLIIICNVAASLSRIADHESVFRAKIMLTDLNKLPTRTSEADTIKLMTVLCPSELGLSSLFFPSSSSSSSFFFAFGCSKMIDRRAVNGAAVITLRNVGCRSQR